MFKLNEKLAVGQKVRVEEPFLGVLEGTVVAIAPEFRPSDGFRFAGAELGVLVDVPGVDAEVWAFQEDTTIIE